MAALLRPCGANSNSSKTAVFTSRVLLNVGYNSVVLIRGQQEVTGQIDLDPLAFPNGQRRVDIQEPVQHTRGRLRQARSHAGAVCFTAALTDSHGADRTFGRAGNQSQGN